jgi:feruloyl esterase
MKTLQGISTALLLLAATPASAATCEELSKQTFPHTTVTLAQSVAAGALPAPAGRGGAPAAANPFADLPAFCRVAATLKPTPESDIKIEVWMPSTGWNGRFQAVGNGGWNGNIDQNALATALRRGYAAASTDTGHTGGAGPWMQNKEQVIDYGYRAVHEMTATAKSMINALYGNAPRFSYFTGCSAGGRQGVKAAQMHPEDFDGIVAGAPALNATGRAAYAVWVSQNLHKDAASYIPPAKYPAIHDAALTACDAQDGVADKVIENPRACKFDPQVLACKAGEDTNACLTPAQVTSARALYQPLVNPRTKQVINTPLEVGSELGWSTFGGQQPFAVATQFYQFMVFNNPQWDWKTLNFDADMANVAKVENGIIDAKSTDLKKFVGRGGKLIQYHGWADPQIPAGASTSYYEEVLKTMGPAVKDNYRLFMVPGMNHCGGGDGPASFDMLTALEQWVEQKKTPDTIPAAHVTNGQPDRTRILCAYPQVATYKGAGNPNDAANFACK